MSAPARPLGERAGTQVPTARKAYTESPADGKALRPEPGSSKLPGVPDRCTVCGGTLLPGYEGDPTCMMCGREYPPTLPPRPRIIIEKGKPGRPPKTQVASESQRKRRRKRRRKPKPPIRPVDPLVDGMRLVRSYLKRTAWNVAWSE